ncbi:LysR family transcriptional regulator [Plastoroseomonas hellenica]|uniref:LysR family transcriptional regulator n=1 Tax=Plastoroseomonas hellenica TaxID=2687306 RepID=UPI001BA79596|nr:LysR family transcriptional regulator [Plastoroseomonas hellenica]MBR0641567.1 LysR family transcriptional regulator [Plastoroseomonas hellenica]
MVEFRSLEVFYWVATLRSFQRAAERLYTTQPAVSQRIAALELELGGKLLERTRRAAILTAKGKVLLEHADRLLQMRTEMLNAVAAPASFSGLVRLGVSETIAQTWLPDFIERVSRAHPSVTFDIEVDLTTRMKGGLLRQELDLGLFAGPIAEPDFIDLELHPFQHAFACSPRLGLGQGPVPAEVLARQAFVTYPRNTPNYHQLQRVLRERTQRTPRIHVSASIATIIRMAVDGIGICVIPEAVMRPALANGELQLIDAGLEMPPIRLTATCRAAPAATLMPTLAKMAVEVARTYAVEHKLP